MDMYKRKIERERERGREERMERELRESQRGCERTAGFPGFVVMTTKPLLPDQTEIRADGNAYTTAHRERERRKDAEGRKKPGGTNARRRRERVRERDGAAERTKRRSVSLSKSYPHGSFNRPVLPPFLSPSPQIVPQPPLSGRRLLHRASRASDSQPSWEMNRRIECFDPLSTEFVAPLSVILHRESLVVSRAFSTL